ncbi:DUF3426 domain-containing protein [Maridesulfovibrio hydrothermalis]|uniref:Zinc finger/thioredoxin putative domain-containing protein n=1 Tax=Maridesulfovibrio hydrothermalis AM13 = DSM 14728 TaxID=1121451 RepID=L0RAG8_9BACT|nr:DUF3426 domain-containing protein [Maridesulfovibrio hydrothermalis]CCO23185.1 conserved protein of unknown function [Maridesulfovibrio hydrothermalis AM13 = DSM 14728]
MIITCSNCETKFNLPESKIPAGGAKVKCSKCGNIFKVTPPVQEPEDEVASMLEEEQAPPVPKPKPKPESKPAPAAVPEPESKPAPEPEPESKPKSKPAPAPEPEPEAEKSLPDDDDLFAEAADELGGDLDDELFGETGGEESSAPSGGSDDLEDDLFGSDDTSEDADLGADLFEDDDFADKPASAAAPEDSAKEDDFDIDDELFGDDDDESATGSEEPAAAAEEDDPFDDELFGDDDDKAESEDFSEDELFGDDDATADSGDDFEEDEDFEEENFDEDDDLDLDDGEIAGFDLDEDLDTQPDKKKGKGMIITLVLLLFFGCGAGAAWYFKVWESLPFDIPFISSNDAGNSDANEPPSKRFSKFSFKDLRQFYVNNDKAGQLFIIEGKVVNNFSQPKELIEVEAQLFDDKSQVLDSKRLLCGNTLSLFQLEVQSREEIEAGLASKVGILSNNTLLKPGMDTPFMVVFFKPSPAVKEYVINVIEAKNPPKK